MDLQLELVDLRSAEQSVELARRCANRQQEIVDRLCSHDLDTADARRLLATTQETLSVA
jgi:hypothetical protein